MAGSNIVRPLKDLATRLHKFRQDVYIGSACKGNLIGEPSFLK